MIKEAKNIGKVVHSRHMDKLKRMGIGQPAKPQSFHTPIKGDNFVYTDKTEAMEAAAREMARRNGPVSGGLGTPFQRTNHDVILRYGIKGPREASKKMRGFNLQQNYNLTQ